ncbi:BEM3 [[Candida] subhashii]|uniref:BEM3 n=1 Tax=[Candida] subhashii TaxID=561895 RepID=A0A8J5QGR1_9ASCO|nr:BEM3 [[Candida] subhashii]KAG7662757.1 BEM3 [[Candida] subhashii]
MTPSSMHSPMKERHYQNYDKDNDGTVQEYTPSDPRFDRSKLSDCQFIEQLLFENRELKALLERQNKTLERLNIELGHTNNNHNNNNKRHHINGKVTQTELLPPNSPPEKIITSQKSTKSIHSSDDTPQSPTRRAAPHTQRSKQKEQQVLESQDSISSKDSITNGIPMRSSRRGKGSSDILSSKDITVDSIPNSLNNLSIADENDTGSLLSSYEHDDVAALSKDSFIAPPHSSANPSPVPVRATESIESHEDTTIKSHYGISDSTGTSATSAISRVYSEEKGISRSSSSVGSTYKSSRIKLPPNSAHQAKSNTTVDSIADMAPVALKSPVMYQQSPSSTTGSRYESPTSQTAPSFASRNDALASPDKFGNKFTMKLNDIPNPLIKEEGTKSQISSPLPGSFIHCNDSPVQQLAPPYEPGSLRPSFKSPPMPSSAVYGDHPSTPGSSFNVIHSSTMEMDESSLFIKPDEFQTIYVFVISTINVNSEHQTTKKSDDPNITMTINDRATDKEMWRIRKTYSQLCTFDTEIRPIIEYFGLPPLPDKTLFVSTTPSKIESRRSALQNYFGTIFRMPHLPRMVVYKICSFLSLDFVNPLDDFKSGARKEGFLIRRYKGLGSTWKIRWCQVDGPYLEIYENPGGPLIESIPLTGAQIGRQSSESIVAEDKGYRHAFLVMEGHKSSKLQSSLPKHFFCAETDLERDEWVNVLVEFSDNDQNSPRQGGAYEFAETPSSTRYESFNNDDIMDSKKYLHTPASYANTSNDQMSTYTSASNEEIPTKEQKKARKKSFFPWGRSNAGAIPLELDETDMTAASSQSTTTQIVPNETSMQHYLNQLNLDEDVAKTVFGRNVEVAYELSNHEYMGRRIPSVCFRCIDYLNKTGAVFEEGIFRLSGSASTIRQLKEQFNTHYDIDLFDCSLKPDIHTVAGLFKTYLRELPCPIMGLETYNHLNSLIYNNKSSSPSEIAILFRDYFNDSVNVDQIHYDICYVIFKFLRSVISQNQSNRMNLRNVCIVFVPTLNVTLEVLSTFLVDFECIFEKGRPISDDRREILDLHIPNF